MEATLAGLVLTVTLVLILIRPGDINEAWWAALGGVPGEELVQAAREQRVETTFVGLGNPATGGVITASGVLKDWRRNRHGDPDGFYLEDRTGVGFPPHKASEVRAIADQGTSVEVQGELHGERLHAYSVTARHRSFRRGPQASRRRPATGTYRALRRRPRAL